MGEVTDVRWKCPGCGEPNTSQIYGFWDDETEEDGGLGLEHTEIPFAAASLRWSPPCKKCGKYKLTEPDTIVTLPIVKVMPRDEREGYWKHHYDHDKTAVNPFNKPNK